MRPKSSIGSRKASWCRSSIPRGATRPRWPIATAKSLPRRGLAPGAGLANLSGERSITMPNREDNENSPFEAQQNPGGGKPGGNPGGNPAQKPGGGGNPGQKPGGGGKPGQQKPGGGG